MKALEKSDKDAIKLRFAVALSKLLEKSDIKSLKHLAREAGMEPSHIQKIAAGKVDVALTTNISLVMALGISYVDLASAYDGVTDNDTRNFIQKQYAQKNLKGQSKMPLRSSLSKAKPKGR